MIVLHLLAITLAFLLDKMIGDPPTWPHPVRWIGALISFFERRWNKGDNRRLKGVWMLLFVLLSVSGLSMFFVYIAYFLHPSLGVVVESIIISTTIAGKSLKDAATQVYDPLEKGDLIEARKKLSYIVGRDTEQLDEAEVIRGTVETVAENTSDGVTAPLFWALLGGAPLAIAYRAINTCDSMVGHMNDRYLEFGWASAKLDDLVNWIPSRITAFLMLFIAKPEHINDRHAWKILLRDAKRHPSPNSGWGEAAVAVILGVQLGGINYYKGLVSDRAKMGEPFFPLQKEHILKTNKILKQTANLFILFLWMGGMFLDLAFAWF